ncbi:hypothetical protein Ahu01nite_076760 [Winogradskya humida]|uniref:Uncharacterized protein n=1 Tax=Winogradskya humida TaxID=113566 RepID=A0ABQ4A150_9ACTN|nr:hypothetical protein Ahu01nite_076760 [Actinoplanes humidus]
MYVTPSDPVTLERTVPGRSPAPDGTAPAVPAEINTKVLAIPRRLAPPRRNCVLYRSLGMLPPSRHFLGR